MQDKSKWLCIPCLFLMCYRIGSNRACNTVQVQSRLGNTWMGWLTTWCDVIKKGSCVTKMIRCLRDLHIFQLSGRFSSITADISVNLTRAQRTLMVYFVSCHQVNKRRNNILSELVCQGVRHFLTVSFLELELCLTTNARTVSHTISCTACVPPLW